MKPFAEANHPPVAAINGDKSDAIVHHAVRPGDTITLNASGSSDPDGDPLDLRWYYYPEAGTYAGELPGNDLGKDRKCVITVPPDAAGSEIHLILEITDQNEIVPLADYRRIVITVAPQQP